MTELSAVVAPRSFNIKFFRGLGGKLAYQARQPYVVQIATTYLAKGCYHFGDLLSQIPLESEDFDRFRAFVRHKFQCDIALYERDGRLIVEDVVNRKSYWLHFSESGELALDPLVKPRVLPDA